MNRKIALTALAAAVTLAAPRAAFAAAAGEVETHHAMVMLNDLDLTTEAGTATMQSRVKRAANKVCQINGDPSLRARMAERACFTEAMRNSANQMAAAVSNASKGG
jgi:UrcA family protein